jgi:hypothetical protein
VKEWGAALLVFAVYFFLIGTYVVKRGEKPPPRPIPIEQPRKVTWT